MQACAVKGYQTASVNTVDRLKLVLMCYEAAIVNAMRAQEEIRAGNVANKGLYLNKATSIVSELMNVLDKKQGGEVAERLEALYQYVLQAFAEANLRMDAGVIDGALRVLRELKSGWEEISRQGVR